MSDDLVLSLDFESIEGDPPRFVDGSGRGNHAVAMAYSTAEPIGITRDRGGRVGKGLNVQKSNWAAVPSDDLNLTRSVNVECWFRPAFDIGARVHTWRGILGKGICGATDVYGLRFKGHTQQLQFVIRSGGRTFVAEAPVELRMMQWVHLRGAYDGRIIRLFKDGALLAETAHTGRIDVTPDPLLIGTGWGPDYKVAGVIDSVRIRGSEAAPAPNPSGRIQVHPHEDERSVIIRVPAFPRTPFGYVIPEKAGAADGAVYSHLEWSPIEWHGPDEHGVIGYRGENEKSVFTARLIPGVDSVEVHQSIRNRTDRVLEHAYSFHCLTACTTPAFADFDRKRTFVAVEDRGLLSTRQLLGPDAIRGVIRMARPRFGGHEFIDDLGTRPGQAVAKPRAGEPFMFIESVDGGWIAAAATSPACFLYTNGGNSCIHACPYFEPIAPGEEGTTVSRLYFLRGGVQELRRRMKKDFSPAP